MNERPKNSENTDICEACGEPFEDAGVAFLPFFAHIGGQGYCAQCVSDAKEELEAYLGEWGISCKD